MSRSDAGFIWSKHCNRQETDSILQLIQTGLVSQQGQMFQTLFYAYFKGISGGKDIPDLYLFGTISHWHHFNVSHIEKLNNQHMH